MSRGVRWCPGGILWRAKAEVAVEADVLVMIASRLRLIISREVIVRTVRHRSGLFIAVDVGEVNRARVLGAKTAKLNGDGTPRGVVACIAARSVGFRGIKVVAANGTPGLASVGTELQSPLPGLIASHQAVLPLAEVGGVFGRRGGRFGENTDDPKKAKVGSKDDEPCGFLLKNSVQQPSGRVVVLNLRGELKHNGHVGIRDDTHCAGRDADNVDAGS